MCIIAYSVMTLVICMDNLVCVLKMTALPKMHCMYISGMRYETREQAEMQAILPQHRYDSRKRHEN